MPAKKMRAVRLGFVDLGGDAFPLEYKDYPLVASSSQYVGALPYPDGEFKRLRLQVLNMYVEDLPDFTNRNEGLLKLGGHTRTMEDAANKEVLTYSIDFKVKDRNYSSGFLHRVVFRNVLLRQFFDLNLNLIELDKGVSATYEKVSNVLKDSGLDSIDAINSIPFIKVASKIFDGIIKTFGKDHDDVVWSEFPGLDLNPAPGGAFLRTGVYVLYERKSLYSTRRGRQKPGKVMPLTKLVFRNNEICHPSEPQFPLSNHMIFNILLENAD